MRDDFIPTEEAKAIKTITWDRDEPVKGKKCSVLKKSLWYSQLCQSKEYFVCIGKKSLY